MSQIWKETVRPPSLRHQVIDQIINAIAQGHLKPGERIVEVELAQKFGISRGPVREALSTLAQDGIVEILPYKGTYVVELDKKEIWDIFMVRSLLEGFAIRRIMESEDRDSTTRQLWEIYYEMTEWAKGKPYNKMAELDMKFHETLVLAAGNHYLYKAWVPLKYRVLLYFILTNEKRYETFDAFLELHADLIRIMESGDTERAVQELDKHILQAGEELLKHM
jgi:DNA-binding GntR family transcriptional regulator